MGDGLLLKLAYNASKEICIAICVCVCVYVRIGMHTVHMCDWEKK